MIQSTHCELKRMLSSKTFRLSVLLSCVFAICDIIQNIYYKSINVNDFSVFEKWMGTSNETFGALSFYWFFPILASLPYAWTMCDELHSGYAMQVFIRTSKKDYIISKIVSSFMSGGIVISCALILDILLLTMIDRTYFPQPNDLISSIWSGSFCSALYYTHPVVFVAVWTCIEFLWGGVIAVLCCSLGFFMKNKVVLLSSMMLIYVSEAILSEFLTIKRNGYYIETSWLMLTHADTFKLNPGFVIFGSIGFILFVGIILSFIKGVRYEAL